MYPRGHNHWRSQGFSTGGGGQSEGATQWAEGVCVCVWGGGPLPRKGDFLKFVYQNIFFAH